MKISVACCTYNGARYLDEQLRSLVEQTVRPDEIVVVDDASSDDTMRVIERFARDAGVDVVVERNTTNQGVVANFEKAIARTSGDLVFLCDQDDRWHPTKIETMRRAFDARTDLLLLHTDGRLVAADGTPLGHTLFEALRFGAHERRQIHAGAAFQALLVRNLVTGATLAMRRAVFEAARPFPPEWVHDEWLAIVAASMGTVDVLELALIDYRQHDANQIGMRRLTLAEKFARLRVRRGVRYAKAVRRIEVLRERLTAMHPATSHDLLARVDAKIVHARVRAGLPAHRVARLAPVAIEATTGRYGRYSMGFESIVRDCLEPH